MKKSDFASEMENILNTYLDYLEFGFNTEHAKSDFSHLDIVRIEERKSVQPVQTAAALKQQPAQVQQRSLPPQGTRRALIDLAASVLSCSKCTLSQRARQKVPGAGFPGAKLFIITYPVSPDEEQGGIPFARRFREDLTKWLSAIGIRFEDVFITNILKCCPHRAPLGKDHFEACRTYLDSQIKLVNPAVIMTLGQVTISSLLRQYTGLQEKHGTNISYLSSFPVIPTYHPFDVIKNPSFKRAVWEDLKKIKQLIGP